MYKYNKNNKDFAKSLRKDMTLWERKLWYTFLSQQPQKFYRQKLVDNYILDFYCPKLKLAIELDGSQHYNEEDIEYDKERTEVLSKLGIKVVRFTNLEIDKNFNGVCEEIYELLNSK